MKLNYFNKTTGETIEIAIDNELYKILLLMKQRVDISKNDNLIVIDGDTGCLSGDTIINTKDNQFRIDELYHLFQLNKINKKYNIPSYVRSFNGKYIRFNKIKNVFYSGKKEVYKLTLENGLTIKATSNHKFYKRFDEWTELNKLKNQDVIMCDHISRGQTLPKFSEVLSIESVGQEDTYDIECEEPNHNFVANGIIVHNSGKSNLAALICAAWASINNKTYTNDDVYFDSEAIIKRAIASEEQTFHYDESLFSAMATDWQQKEQKRLIKMLLLARKKRHFFVFCIPNFFKLKDTISLEKCNGLIHTYLRNGTTVGQFAYFRKDSKDILYNAWKKGGIKGYKKFWSFRGTFGKYLPKVISEDEYERRKDIAILSMNKDEEKVDKGLLKYNKLAMKVGLLHELLNISQEEVAKLFNVSKNTIQNWKKLAVDEQKSQEKEGRVDFNLQSRAQIKKFEFESPKTEDLAEDYEQRLKVSSNASKFEREIPPKVVLNA